MWHRPKLKPIHRDFYPDQIIVFSSRKKIYVVDFDLFFMGDPAVDIGNFLGHLTEYSLRKYGDVDALREHEEVLLKSFIDFTDDSERIPIKIYALLTLMCHIYLITLISQERSLVI